MTKRSIWASLVFGITFTLVTAYLLVNIFISIVEEAYFIARKQGRYLELLMWRNLKVIAKSKHPDPGEMDEFDVDATTLVIAPNPTSKHSTSLLGQLQELDKLTTAPDVSTRSEADRPDVNQGEDKLRDTLTEQHQSRSYRALVKELLDATVPDSHFAERQGLQPNSLTITLAEETAEMYILGRNHWEYSKVTFCSMHFYTFAQCHVLSCFWMITDDGFRCGATRINLYVFLLSIMGCYG